MRFPVLFAVCCLARFAPAQEAACHPVEGDRILGKDLAEALPAFQSLPPDMFIASMPPAGAQRTLHIPELVSLGQRYSIRFDNPQETCFDWRMEPLDAARAAAAMRQSLPPSASLEVVETNAYQTPHGRLEFPISGLGQPATPDQKDPVLWRGEDVYGGSHRFAIWAKVRVKVPCQRVLAIQTLRTQELISAGQFRIEKAECFPSMRGWGDTAAISPLGMVAVRPIAAGSEIRPEFVAPPNDINRGDTVVVDVRSGSAHITFTAKAESAGRQGDFIVLRNPSSNRVFRARVQGKDQASIQADLFGSN